MPNLTLLGCYSAYKGASWNPDSRQPDVQAWKSGRDEFAAAVGHSVNAGNIFTGPSNVAVNVKNNLAYTMSQANLIYTNPPYDYIPAIGLKLLQTTGDKSPSTGKAYVWNDHQAYIDVKNGLWDDSWIGVVDTMVAANRTVWFQRMAYEGNMGYMQDFSGYDSTPSQVADWCAAVRHVFQVIQTRAAALGAHPIIGFNPSAAPGQNNPNVNNMFNAIGADVQNCIAFDCYNGYWNLTHGLPSDTSGAVAGVGPSQADLISTWNTQNGGYGFSAISALAIANNMPLALLEVGSSGGDHHTKDDPYFYPWLASVIQAHRNAGGRVICVNIWSVNAGDGDTRIDEGYQPNTLASLKPVIGTMVGDTFDPTTLKFGGGIGTTTATQSLTLSLAGSGNTYGSPFIATINAALPLGSASQLSFQLSEVNGAELASGVLQAALPLSSLGYTPTSEVLTNSNKTLTLTAPGGQDQTWIALKMRAVDSLSGATSNTVTMSVNQVYTNFAFSGTTLTFNAGRDPFATDFGASFVPTGGTVPTVPQVKGATITGKQTGLATMPVSLPGLSTSGAGTIYLYAITSGGTAPPVSVFTTTVVTPPPPPVTVPISLTAAQFVALWQYVYNYMTSTKGLTNLLWLYDVLSPFSTFTQALTRYPGASYVDITGLDLFTSNPVSVLGTDVITVSAIPSPVAGSTFSLVGTGSLPWTGAAAVQVSFGATTQMVGAQASGYTVTLSNNGRTATVIGLVAPTTAGNYVAYMGDSGAGVTSAGVGYVVTAAPASGSASSVAGLPYLGWGLPQSFPGSGAVTAGVDNAELQMGSFISNFGKPTTMLLTGGAFDTPANVAAGINSYVTKWGSSTSYNGTLLGYKLTPVLGLPLTTTDGTMTNVTIQAGTNDAAIQAYLQTLLNLGYKQLIVRIAWEDQLPTCPSGMGAIPGTNFPSGSYCPWTFYGCDTTQHFSANLAALQVADVAQYNYCDNYIKSWRHMAYVIKQFATANAMKVWTVWGPTITSSCYIDPRLMYPDTASYVTADGHGLLVDVHGPDVMLGNLTGDVTHFRAGYQNNAAATPFNGSFASTGTPANVAAFAADLGSEYYWLDFTGGGGSAAQTSYNSNPLTALPWSGGWGVFESMVFALQQHCMWTIPQFGATANSSASVGGKNNGINPYDNTTLNAPNYPELAAWLRPRVAWYQSLTNNGIFAGQVLQVSWGPFSTGNDALRTFATRWPEFATNSGNNPFAGEAGVAFPAPR
jgi:hypothetical protein